MICRVVRTYGMAYREVMSLPMRVFWEFSGNVDRIRMDEAKLTLEVSTAASTPENAGAMRDHLAKAAPDPIQMSGQGKMNQNAERDDAGFEDLRSMAASM